MGKAEKYNQMIQMMWGIHKLCANFRGDCQRCPFHMDRCVFGEPMPKSWLFEDDDDEEEEEEVLDEVEAEIKAAPSVANAFVPLVREPVVDVAEIEEKIEPPVEEKVPEPEPAPIEVKKVEERPADPVKTEEVIAKGQDDDSNGTWIVSTTQGGVLTKYVYICSKCGYKRESVFSIPPMNACPECEKRKKQSVSHLVAELPNPRGMISRVF